jgi:hypothetical protein
MMFVTKVKDNPDLVKDKSNGALLNVDETALEAYRRRRDFTRKQQALVKDVVEIKDELTEIRNAITIIAKSLEFNSGNS